METVRCGRNCDLPAVREIWNECFSADCFCDWFFARLYDPHCLRVLEVNGEIVSMAFCFPRQVDLPKESLAAWYLYGIGTRINERGKGYAKRLITACVEEAWKNGVDLCFLIPAEESLFSYYKTCGFETVWTRKEWCGSVSVNFSNLELRLICDDFSQINQLYERAFPARVKRNLNDWQLIFEDFRLGGGKLCLFLRGKTVIGYCCILKQENTLFVRELGILPGERAEIICEELAFLENADTWRYTAPGQGVPFAVVSSRKTLDSFEVNCDLMYN